MLILYPTPFDSASPCGRSKTARLTSAWLRSGKRATREAFTRGFATKLSSHCRLIALLVFVALSIGIVQVGKVAAQEASRQESAEVARALALMQEFKTLFAAGKFKEALKPCETALAVFEKEQGPYHANISATLNNLAAVRFELGDYKATESLYKRAIEMVEMLFGPQDRRVAASLNNLGVLYRTQANFAAALPLHERALSINEKELGPNHRGTALAMMNLGEDYREQLDFEKAEPLYRRALKILDASQDRDLVSIASCSSSLGLLYVEQQNFSAAEPLYRRAMELTPNHPQAAIILSNLAALYELQGNFGNALTLRQRSLQINLKERGSDHRDTADSLMALARHASIKGENKLAEKMYLQALEIFAKTLGNDHPRVHTCQNNLGVLYSDIKNYSAAEAVLLQSLKLNESANTLNSLGVVYSKQGASAKAVTFFQKALKSNEATKGLHHPDSIANLNNLAVILEPDNKRTAFEYADRLQHAEFIHARRVLPALSEKEQQLFLHNVFRPSLSCSVSQAFRSRDDSEIVSLSSEWLINSKGLANEVSAQRNLLARDSKNATLAEGAKKLGGIRRQLATIAMTGVDSAQASARSREIDRLASEEQRLVRELNGGGQAASAWVDSAQLRGSLAPRSVFIDIIRYKYSEFALDNSNKEHRYAALVTPAAGEGEVRFVNLGSADALDLLVAQVRELIQRASEKTGSIASDGEEVALGQLQPTLRELSERLLTPLTREFQDAEHVIVSPDGALWLVPWSALPILNANQVEEMLIEKSSIRFVTSARALLRPANKPVSTSAPIIMANPRFDQSASEKKVSIEAIFKRSLTEDDVVTRSFSAKSTLPKASPLPNTELEATTIQSDLEKYAGAKGTFYNDRYALESVAKGLSRPKAVVFATHGFFLADQKLDNADERFLSNFNGGKTAMDKAGKPMENPLLRCGLLLAGCNNREAAISQDDGILTGLEILGMDLRGTELVVLSACETGVGQVNVGEGVSGLRQAFQNAGAKNVVASLWQVPDRDSALIMSDFFANLSRGESTAESMRSAQLKRIKTRRERFGVAHPFYWAAWTVTE